MEFKDYYQTLGVARTASAAELKKAFRTLARKYHPDVNPGDASAEHRFKEINEAYEVVGDPDRRRKYDELGANWKAYEQAPPAGHPFAGGGGPFGAGGGVRWNVRTSDAGGGVRDEGRGTFGDDPFSDFFRTFFGGAARPSGARGRPSRQRGRDLEHELTVTLEQAYAGVTQRLTLTTGDRTRAVDVRIPAGVAEGSRVRVPGEGEPGRSGGAAGDLFLRIKEAPHPVYERRGRDLYLQTTVPLTVAVLGGEVEIATISGGTVRLKIPATTQQGQVFRVKGQGMPSVRRSATRGHVYATVNVQLPARLTDESRAHFEALAALDTG